jgi:hypothetical protein
MGKPHTWTFPTASTANIAQSQTSTGTPLVINGSLLDTAATMKNVFRVKLDGIERTVTLTGTGADLSAVTFTVSGVDLNGNVLATGISGPTGTTTVATTNFFATINAIGLSGSISTSVVTAGTGPNGRTNWYEANNWVQGGLMTLSLGMTTTGGSITVQDCQEANPTATSATIFAHPTLATVTQSAHSNYDFPPRWVRATATSFTGSFGFTIIQGG